MPDNDAADNTTENDEGSENEVERYRRSTMLTPEEIEDLRADKKAGVKRALELTKRKYLPEKP